MWIWGGHEVYSSVDQTKKMKTKKKGLQYKCFHKFWLSSQNSFDFPRILKWRPKKTKVSSQKFYEIRCESTKTAKKQFSLANSRTVNTNLGALGLALHSSSPGAQFLFGGTSSHLGGHGPGIPPVVQGRSNIQYCRICAKDLLLVHRKRTVLSLFFFMIRLF